MDRVIAAFRLLTPRLHRPGPMRVTSGSDVPPAAIGEFLDAIYIAVEKLRAFGLADDVISGPIKVVRRTDGERANGRYFPKDDSSLVFYPPVRGAPDWVWTIVHEIAHRVWNKHISSQAKEVWKLVSDSIGKPIDANSADALTKMVERRPDRYNMWFFFKKHFGTDLGLFRQWLQTRRVSSSFPSDYANADPSESFAEVMADTVLGRGHAGAGLRRSSSIVKKVFLSLVAPLRGGDFGFVCDESILEQADENSLQVQVDFPVFSSQLDDWVHDNLRESDIIKRPTRPHVTVLNGADRRDIEEIKKIVGEVGRPIRASIGALNAFDYPDYDVLYLEMISDPMVMLHHQLKSLDHTRPLAHRLYIPHLTVAYLKKGSAKKFMGVVPFKKVLSSNRITLIDFAGIETTVTTSPPESPNDPLLLAGS